MNQLITYCKNIHPLSIELENALVESSIRKTYKAGEYLLKQGTVANYATYIVSGLVHSFYVRDIEEITTKFLAEGSIITSIYSFYSRKAGKENIIALEDTELICVHYNAMQKMLNEFAEFNFIVRVITEQYLFFSEIEIYNLRKQNAEERYRFFLKHHNALLQRVPLKYIASYLNMSIETLSRMRSKVRIS
jgi:CRP-like cAMP-binding protein